jgi:predicted transcriptional regulator
MTDAPELVAFTVRLSREEHDRLTRLADDEHRSLGAEARRAIVAHLEQVQASRAA